MFLSSFAKPPFTANAGIAMINIIAAMTKAMLSTTSMRLKTHSLPPRWGLGCPHRQPIDGYSLQLVGKAAHPLNW